jgi:hypothetical protein
VRMLPALAAGFARFFRIVLEAAGAAMLLAARLIRLLLLAATLVRCARSTMRATLMRVLTTLTTGLAGLLRIIREITRASLFRLIGHVDFLVIESDNWTESFSDRRDGTVTGPSRVTR